MERPAHLPEGRWLGDFGELSAAEMALVVCCAQGVLWQPKNWDGERPEAPTVANTIRAGLIRFLLLGGDVRHPVHETGVMIGGGWISGQLNLHQAQTVVRLHLLRCNLANSPIFIAAHMPELALDCCLLPELKADRLTILGNISLNNGFYTTGEVRLMGANIGGDLDCRQGHFHNSCKIALNCDGIKVAGSIFLNDGFSATGEVRLPGATVGRDLTCSNAEFSNCDGVALNANSIKITGNVSFDSGFSATGEVRLLGGMIGGDLTCSGGQFRNCPGRALSADGINVTGSVFLNDEFSATGEVRLLSATVGRDLACRNGKFHNAGSNALAADGIEVTGTVFLDDGFCATGTVRLLSATIGGNLECDKSQFRNSNGDALSADRIKVTGGVFLRDGFFAQGEVRLLGATIGGNLECRNGQFTKINGNALSADGIKVTGSVFLNSAKINGGINLASAHIGTFVDDNNCWEAKGHTLDGLQYDRIIGSIDAASRIAWLNTQRADHLEQPDFTPQPWEQLIRVLRDMGHLDDAAKVAVAKQDHMYKNQIITGFWPRALHRVYGVLAGYGHKPLETVKWMVAVWLAITTVFYIGAGFGYLGPSTPLIHASPAYASCGAPGDTDAAGKQKKFWATQCPLPPEYTTLEPALYSLDLILPLVNLQQEADWSPIVSNHSGNLLWGHLLRLLMWFEILFGWGASLMLVAVLGRLVEKD